MVKQTDKPAHRGHRASKRLNDAAREQQDQEEARIKQISEILSNSTTERTGVVEGDPVELRIEEV